MEKQSFLPFSTGIQRTWFGPFDKQQGKDKGLGSPWWRLARYLEALWGRFAEGWQLWRGREGSWLCHSHGIAFPGRQWQDWSIRKGPLPFTHLVQPLSSLSIIIGTAEEGRLPFTENLASCPDPSCILFLSCLLHEHGSKKVRYLYFSLFATSFHM